MNQHFRKRKARSSSAPVSPRRAACATPTDSDVSPLLPLPLSLAHTDASATIATTSATPASPAPMDGINLSAALTALKVSLKREMDSFIPPTPAASPIHARSAKRARFDFGVILPDPSEGRLDSSNTTKTSPLPKMRGMAFLSVSKKLKQELERTARPDSSDHTLRARKRRQQLSYFAIASAFHRAATHESERALVPAE